MFSRMVTPQVPILRVRGVFWALLGGALLVAIAMPTATIWHAATSPLAARAYLWPDTPRVNTPAQLLVELADAHDRTALQGPWATITVRWDMLAMTMGTRSVVIPGSAPSRPRAHSFVVPLRLDMAGRWWMQVSLRTPGRPEWHAALQVTVLPAALGSPAALSQHPLLASAAPPAASALSAVSYARDG